MYDAHSLKYEELEDVVEGSLLSSLKNLLTESKELRTTPIPRWSIWGHNKPKDIVDMGHEADLIDLQVAESWALEENYNN